MKIVLAYATKQGMAHAFQNVPNQDEIAFCEKEDVKVLTFCDGAGSQPLSKEGAKIAAAMANKLLTEEYDFYRDHRGEETSYSFLKKINEKIRQKSLELGCSMEELACTLISVVTRGDQIHIYHEGDGCVILERNCEYRMLSGPENGDCPNSTFFVSVSHPGHLRFIKRTLKPNDRILIMTDGVENDFKKERDTNNAEKYQLLLNQLEISGYKGSIVEDFLFRSVTETDDLSLGIIKAQEDPET